MTPRPTPSSPRKRRCLNWTSCKTHAAPKTAYCGRCFWRDQDRSLMRRLAQLQPGERMWVGAGWSIVRVGNAPVPLPRRQPDLLDD